MDTTQRSEKGDISRRRFLKQTAGAGAAFAIVNASTARGTAANSKIEIGVVGCGGRGKWLAEGFMAHGGYQVTALADYFPEEMEHTAGLFDIPESRCFSGLKGYERLLESGVDAVALETPPYCFPEHVEASVEAGCHVFMAKPVAVDSPGTRRVRDMGRKAGENGLCFLVDFQMRTHPYIIEAVERVHGGALETVGMVNSRYTDEGFSDPPLEDTFESRLRRLVWVNDTNLGGGYFVNAGIHAMDAALWVINETPVRAVGGGNTFRRDPHGDSHDAYSLTFEFPSGLVLNHWGEHVGNGHGFTCQVMAFGRGAHLETNYHGVTEIRGQDEARYEGGDSGNLYGDGAERNIAEFHRAITEGDFSNPTLEPSVNSNFAVILGREAARRGEALTWDDVLADDTVLEVDTTGLRE